MTPGGINPRFRIDAAAKRQERVSLSSPHKSAEGAFSTNGLVNTESSRKEARLKAAQPQPRSQVCDFFVSNIYVSRVDVADKEIKPSLFERHLNGQSVRASGC